MKKILIAFIWIFLFVYVAPAQEFENMTNEARTSYRQGDLDAARYALQQAMYEVDMAIGYAVLDILPEKLGNLEYSDELVGSINMGFIGLTISRSYDNEDNQSVSVNIIGDSPLLAGVNAILALPVFGSDPNQKRIRVDGYRGLLNKSENSSGDISWDIQIPFGNSLMTIAFKGINDESAVMEMANTLPIQKIAAILQ